MADPFPLTPSLWYATAVNAPSTPRLTENAETEIAIIGAGYAGLSTALHLARKNIPVTLLEAREPGFGGSGRNGGQINPGLKSDPDELVEKFGAEAGGAPADFMGDTASTVLRLIDENKMAVPHARKGWIVAAHSESGLESLRKRHEQWQMRGVEGQLLDREAIADHLGTDKYVGGWLDPRGGALQPLSYARELCRIGQKAGARIHGQTPVTRIEKDGASWWLVTQAGHVVKARKVVVCTNAYTGELWPEMARTIIAANSLQVATAPLSDNLRRTILPYGQHCSDTRKLLLYFRLDHEGRLLMGGRGPFHESEGNDLAHLERVLVRMYSQLKEIPIQYRWGGRVSITRDFLPLANYCASGRRDALPFPITPIKTIPFHALNRLYVAAIVAWYRFSDAGLGSAS